MNNEEWIKNIDMIKIIEQHKPNIICAKQLSIPISYITLDENIRQSVD
jgi:hypothetical protein